MDFFIEALGMLYDSFTNKSHPLWARLLALGLLLAFTALGLWAVYLLWSRFGLRK